MYSSHLPSTNPALSGIEPSTKSLQEVHSWGDSIIDSTPQKIKTLSPVDTYPSKKSLYEQLADILKHHINISFS